MGTRSLRRFHFNQNCFDMRQLMRKWAALFHLKRLEHELWRGKQFQKYCEKIRCHNLAQLEQINNERLKERIVLVKNAIKNSGELSRIGVENRHD